VPLGLDGFFCALPVLEEEPLEPAEPEVPLEPDGLELPEAELPPLDDLLPSLSQPAMRPPLRVNATAATNAVSFILTSMGLGAQTEQGMDREPGFTKVELYTDRDGRARFREERLPLTQGTRESRLSPLMPATGCQLRESPVGFRSAFHCTPRPQWVFILRGEMEIGLQDGSSRRFKAGEHFFSADTLPPGTEFDADLHGHWSAQRGDEPLVTLFVKV
jgi:hypothetical protein